jgi:hypothetical protein
MGADAGHFVRVWVFEVPKKIKVFLDKCERAWSSPVYWCRWEM